ncbi:MAG: IgGFc-binding protein [Deltaproteobacteria bacterium]|nr:IgGFc-binding protein [Deltaproteobacteria bacterium]
MPVTLPWCLALLGIVAGVGGCSCSEEASSAANGEQDAGDGGSGIIDLCEPGQFTCVGDEARVCGAEAGAAATVDCAAQGLTCQEPFGCIACAPGEGTCSGGQATLCRKDGSGYDTFACDPLQGMTCDPDGCNGVCAPRELQESYVGCDYYPTVTLNPVWRGFDFAVAVANAGDGEAEVTVTRGAAAVETLRVAPGSLATVVLPWVDELKGGDEDSCLRPPDPGATRVVKGGAYRLRSDQPVTVYQLSPRDFKRTPTPAGCPLRIDCPFLPEPKDPADPADPANVLRDQFAKEGCLSFSNDASLLLPATALTGSYTTLAWPSGSNTAAFVAITATRDATEVTVRGRGRLAAGAGISETGTGTVTLDQGDVLELVARHTGDGTEFDAEGDPSGTRIEASAPVQVIAGHSCANVPEATTQACDHLEESMLPAETLGTDYLVTFPAARASVSPQLVRIAAVQAGTRLDFNGLVPKEITPASCARGCTIGPDDAPVELRSVTEDFRLTASAPVLVAQYLLGQDAVPSGAGDPSLSLVVPTAQYRGRYVFIAPSTYDARFVNITAKKGAVVTLDGAALPAADFEPIPGSDYAVARHQLDAADVHVVEGADEFGILVYGYGTFTSFMYPGGLDLERIAPPIIY